MYTKMGRLDRILKAVGHLGESVKGKLHIQSRLLERLLRGCQEDQGWRQASLVGRVGGTAGRAEPEDLLGCLLPVSLGQITSALYTS